MENVKILFKCTLQVEFLCERGADVNRGLRSSSLHYAACFGRPQIVKVEFIVNFQLHTSSTFSQRKAL